MKRQILLFKFPPPTALKRETRNQQRQQRRQPELGQRVVRRVIVRTTRPESTWWEVRGIPRRALTPQLWGPGTNAHMGTHYVCIPPHSIDQYAACARHQCFRTFVHRE